MSQLYLDKHTLVFKCLKYPFFSFFVTEINTFIEERCIQIIKSDSNDIYVI